MKNQARSLSPRYLALALLAAFTSAACSGDILDPSSTQRTASEAQNDPDRTAHDHDASIAAPPLDPGRVTLHRLNRAEYTNTTRDLLGTTLRPADDFPPDDRGYGYDNIADVLSLSPVQIEMYWNAASALIADAMDVARPFAQRFEAEQMQATSGAAFDAGWLFFVEGTLSQSVPIARPGQYKVRVRAWAEQGGPDPARMAIEVNALPVATLDVTATAAAPELYETTVTLAPDNVLLGVSFLNDFYDPDAGIDRNLLVDYLELEGPLGLPADNPRRARIMICEPDEADPEPCLREVASSFGRRAFRRPLLSGEVDQLVALSLAARAAGDDLETATRVMLEALLLSPHFLFRVELDPDPVSPAAHPLTQHELASRLSYFLWSSMPDDALLDAADRGELDDEHELRAQLTRMLQDPKSHALLDNFAGQWLFLRAILEHEPDPNTFPDFDAELRSSMHGETERYLREFLFGGEPLDRLLTADFSFLNPRLSQHYELPEVGTGFERVSLQDGQRAGLLTQAGILMVTSYANRTSPVKRGKWVLEQLLCSPPPPPPPGVEGLASEDQLQGSLRERMEAHRKDPVCASCHRVMDPIGFGFEHYDPIGRFRTQDQGFAIDASGALPDGTTFNGPLELAPLLALDPRFPRCLSQQLLTYALGRGTEKHDGDDLDQITQAFVASGYTFRELVQHIVQSDAFRMRRGEPPLPTSAMEDEP